MNFIKSTAVLAAALSIMSCSQTKENAANDGYIGPSTMTIEDGKMTPEVLLSLGRLSDPQLSPAHGYICYHICFVCNVINSSLYSKLSA